MLHGYKEQIPNKLGTRNNSVKVLNMRDTCITRQFKK